MRRRAARGGAGDEAAEESVIVGPTRAEVHAAIAGLPDELEWNDMRSRLRPMFVRRRPMPPGTEKPLRFHVEPSLTVTLGVDIGPAFVYVGPKLLEAWPVGADEALAVALANLRASVAAERFVELEYGTVGDVPLWCYQSHGGLASGLLLVPDELVLRYGDEPRLLIAPMRNLLVAAPFDADRELLEWLRDEISFEDPNGLDLPLFALVDGRLTIDRRQSGRRHMVH
jgi:hypothetical protein